MVLSEVGPANAGWVEEHKSGRCVAAPVACSDALFSIQWRFCGSAAVFVAVRAVAFLAGIACATLRA
jgi:hypothetical protein